LSDETEDRKKLLEALFVKVRSCEECGLAIGNECAFCHWCGHKNVNFDKKMFKAEHGISYNENLLTCQSYHPTFETYRRSGLHGERDEIPMRFCDKCGVEYRKSWIITNPK
jgi:hypothetical protein